MKDCVFCKIAKKETQAQIVDETDKLIVFKDKFPDAPVHLLIVPKKHTTDVTKVDDKTWSLIREKATELAKKYKLKGFRITTNAGDAAFVKHLHIHFLGGISRERKV